MAVACLTAAACLAHATMLVCHISTLLLCTYLISCLTVAKARGTSMRVHFKKAREVGAAIKGKTVDEATTYLKAVLEHKRGVPMRRFTGT